MIGPLRILGVLKWQIVLCLWQCLSPQPCTSAEVKTLTPLEQYIEEALRQQQLPAQTAGSLYTAGARLGDLARDPRSTQLNDLVTIVVNETASAVATGASSADRKSSAASSITAALGADRVGPLANLARLGGQSQMQGQGQTSRSTQLTTTMSARDPSDLPNG